MGDLSTTFDPAAIATNSDAASSALALSSDAASKVEIAQSKASEASVAAAAAVGTHNLLSSSIHPDTRTVSAAAGALIIADDLGRWIVLPGDSAAVVKYLHTEGTGSDATTPGWEQISIAHVAGLSDALSNALSKAGVASAAAASGSDALSKITTRSATWDKASAASSQIVIVSDAASSALALASNALSKAAAASSALSLPNPPNLTRTVILKIYNEASAIASGNGKMYFTVPDILSGANLASCGGHLYTAATSGVVGVQINNVTSGVDMLSANRILEWDATEKDTATAAASSIAIIDSSADGVAVGDEIRVDIDAAASGAKGMEIRLSFRMP